MEIVGTGFFARNLRPLTSLHPEVTLLASGVSKTVTVGDAEYEREAVLVRQVVEACLAQDRTLVFLSTASAGVYGNPREPGRESDLRSPGTPFARHKLGLEAFIASSGVRHLILRMTHTVGEYQTGQLLVGLARQILTGRIEVHHGTRRDLLDMADAVTIIGALLEQEVTGEIVNVASGFAVPIEEIVDGLEEVLGRTARREVKESASVQNVSTEKLRRLVPAVEGLGFGPGYARSVIERYAADIAKAAGE